MSCSNKNYQKSAQMAFNNVSQPVVTEGTVLNILGTRATDTGCSVSTVTNGFQVCNSGLYRISADVTLNQTAAGTSTVQILKDGVALPCCASIDTYETANIATQHIETVICVSTCCNIKPIFSVRISGISGNVTFINANMIKLA